MCLVTQDNFRGSNEPTHDQNRHRVNASHFLRGPLRVGFGEGVGVSELKPVEESVKQRLDKLRNLIPKTRNGNQKTDRLKQ